MRIANAQLRRLRLIALVAALVATVFVASGATLWHSDAHGSDATCPICHVAHMPALQLAPLGIQIAPQAIAWVVTTEPLAGHPESFSLIPPARAPPA